MYDQKNAVRLIRRLLEDQVIACTIGVMGELLRTLQTLVNAGARPGDELVEWMLKMTSEGIRECLHKRELYITNNIIRMKNILLERAEVRSEWPEQHKEIDPNDYSPDYDW